MVAFVSARSSLETFLGDATTSRAKEAIMGRLVDLGSIAPFEVWGADIVARKLEGERITMSVVELAPGSVLPIHAHPAEQLGICIRGEMTFTIGDETRTLGAGGTWCIPADVPHGATIGPNGAIAIDVFSPTRDDWQQPLLALRPPVWPAAD